MAWGCATSRRKASSRLAFLLKTSIDWSENQRRRISPVAIMSETVLVIALMASLAPGLVPVPTQEEPWIVVAPISQPDEAPLEVELEELQKRPGAYREHLIIVSGRLSGIDFPINNQPPKGVSTLRKGSRVVPLLFLMPPHQVGLDLELDAVEQHDVELVGRFADLTSELRSTGEREGAGTQIHGIVVDRLRRLTKPEPEILPPSPNDEIRGGLDERSVQLPGPPRVESSSPKSGARGIAPATVFRIRFSADMNPTTFADNVRLTYSDDASQPLEVELDYVEESRSLVIKPVRKLALLHEIHLTLHVGITSQQGIPLRPDDSSPTGIKLQSRRASSAQPEATVAKLFFFTRGY